MQFTYLNCMQILTNWLYEHKLNQDLCCAATAAISVRVSCLFIRSLSSHSKKNSWTISIVYLEVTQLIQVYSVPFWSAQYTYTTIARWSNTNNSSNSLVVRRSPHFIPFDKHKPKYYLYSYEKRDRRRYVIVIKTKSRAMDQATSTNKYTNGYKNLSSIVIGIRVPYFSNTGTTLWSTYIRT